MCLKLHSEAKVGNADTLPLSTETLRPQWPMTNDVLPRYQTLSKVVSLKKNKRFLAYGESRDRGTDRLSPDMPEDDW